MRNRSNLLKKLSVFLAVGLSLLCLSCSKETITPTPDPDPEDPPVAKDELTTAYLSLLKAWEDGLWFQYVSFSAEGCTVKFTQKYGVTFSSSVLECHDARNSAIPSYYKGNAGTWIVNSINTKIPVSTETDLKKLKPIYSFFRDNSFTLILNNGRVISLVSGPQHLFDSFAITQTVNSKLTSNLDKLVDGYNVRMLVKDDVDNLQLIPSFDITCKSIQVNGKEQTSGVSVQDFSEKVVYDITMFDGQTYSFAVSAIIRGKNYPEIRITTKNNAPIVDKEHYVPGSITFLDKSHWYSSVDSVRYEMTQDGIRGRGNSTWGNPKKPYKIKLDEKSKVFGLKKDKDWVLLANWSDKSLLRNMVAMKLSEMFEMPWTPVMCPAYVYLNGSFLGLYCLTEHKEVGANKVDIDPDAGDVYLEVEQAMDEPTCFYTSSYSVPMMFKDPSIPSAATLKETKNFINNFENALDKGYGADETKGYPHYIDVKSFVDNYIIQELTKNIDGNMRKSTFISRKVGDKLVMCHLWDFDLALGNCNYLNQEFCGGNGLEAASNKATGWYIKNYGRTDGGCGKGWYKTLMKDPTFVKAVKERWKEMMPQMETIPQYIDMQYTILGSAANKNFECWGTLGTHVWPNVFVGTTYKQEIDYLTDFYVSRLNWLDLAIGYL